MTGRTFDSSEQGADRGQWRCSLGVDPLAFPARRRLLQIGAPSSDHRVANCCYCCFTLGRVLCGCVGGVIALSSFKGCGVLKIYHEFNCKYEKLATRSHPFIFYFRANGKTGELQNL